MRNKKAIIPVFVSHRGCPHTCVFCNQIKITGCGTDLSGEQVSRMISRAIEGLVKKSVQNIEVAFYGGSFTALPLAEQAELLRPVTEALKAGQINSIRLSTRPDAIDESICRFLKQYGVQTVELGVQSMNNEVLRLSERGHTKEDTYKASDLLKYFGFKLGIQMMPGLPGASLESDIDTGKQITNIHPDFVRIYPTLVLRDTKLEKLYHEGYYKPLTLPEAVNVCKRLVVLMSAAYIPVIRMGLQASDQINLQGDVIAGPFHPAFRQLVESEIYLDQMLELLVPFMDIKLNQVVFGVPARDISTALGQKKGNISVIKSQYDIADVNIIGDDHLPVHTLVLKQINNTDVNQAKKLPLF